MSPIEKIAWQWARPRKHWNYRRVAPKKVAWQLEFENNCLASFMKGGFPWHSRTKVARFLVRWQGGCQRIAWQGEHDARTNNDIAFGNLSISSFGRLISPFQVFLECAHLVGEKQKGVVEGQVIFIFRIVCVIFPHFIKLVQYFLGR